MQIWLLKKQKLFGEKFGQNVSMISQNHEMISVIVPCFNSGKTLKRTIESVKKQTWQKKEGIGIIIFKNSETFTYTVLSDGQSFDCIEVCGI